MPKLKTHSGTKKRLMLTKTGKVLYRRAGANHFLEKKNPSRKRSFRGFNQLHGKQVKSAKRRLGV